MRTYDVVLVATVKEMMSIEARDEDAAADIALQIAQSGHTLNREMGWEVEEVNAGDPLDVAE